MNLVTDEKSYRQLLLGDRSIQVLGIRENDNIPMAGEVIYYNDFEIPLIVNKSQEVWNVQSLNIPEFLAYVVFDSNYYAAIEAQWKYHVDGECRIYALYVTSYNESLMNFRDTTVLSIGRLRDLTVAKTERIYNFTAECERFEYIGVLSSQICKYHPEMSSDEVGKLTAGIFNGKYFAHLLYLSAAYSEHDLLLGYVIHDRKGNIISEAQADQIHGDLTPELLNECRLLCDEQGFYHEDTKAAVKRRLRLWVYFATKHDTTGVLDVE